MLLAAGCNCSEAMVFPGVWPRIVLYSIPTSVGFRSIKVSAIPTSPDAWQPSDPSASGSKPVPSVRAALHHAAVSSLSQCCCGRCVLDHLARKQPKAGPLASAKATVSGVGTLFFLCEATLSSLTVSILITAYLPHTSSCTHQPLEPSLLSPTLGTKYQILCNPCLSRYRVCWIGSWSTCWSTQISL